jgi:hypothetical protein
VRLPGKKVGKVGLVLHDVRLPGHRTAR